MPYPQEIIEEVRSLNDIVDVVGTYVALKSKGGRHFGLCPFHNERTPSFSVSADKQMFHCFGCGAGGNVFSFVMKIENYDFTEALKLLADRVHFILPQPQQTKAARQAYRDKEIMAEMHAKAARFFYDNLQADTPEARAARQYLDKRGVAPKIRVKYGIGLSPPDWDKLFDYLKEQGYEPRLIAAAGLAATSQKRTDTYYDRFRGRLMFPILEAGGKVIGFGGRVMDGGEPKYLNSPETPLFNKSRCLYGLNLARKAKASEMILVEGYMDVISLYQAGFYNVAGVLGTALTGEHARLLKRGNCESVLLLLDSDEAGTAAALRAIPALLASGLKVRVLQVTGAKDPDEYIKQYGPVHFGRLLETARSHVAFRVELLRRKYDLSQTEQRVAFTQEAAALLASLSSAIETDAYMKEIAALTGISPDAIRAEVERGRATEEKVGASGYIRPRSKSGDAGLNGARGGLLQILFSNPAACRALERSGALMPAETGDEVTAKLLTLAFACGRANRTLAAADALTYFDTLEEQQRASELLRGAQFFDSDTEVEKALNEMISVIKRAWIEHRIQTIEARGENSLNAVKTLQEARRNLQKQYITMTDG